METRVIKTVGRRRQAASPEECFWRAHALIEQVDRLNPYPRPRGFVKKFRSYADYEGWRAEQRNPRLW